MHENVFKKTCSAPTAYFQNEMNKNVEIKCVISHVFTVPALLQFVPLATSPKPV